MKANQTDHYFSEWWERQAIRFAATRGVTILGFMPQTKEIRVFSGYVGGRIEPAPIFMMEWHETNPEPGMRRDEFIVALAKRVEALEAALAGKGGEL